MIFKKLVAALTLSFTSISAFSAVITGSLGIGGAYNATGGSGLADATDFTIDTVVANVGSGELLSGFNFALNPGVGGAGVSLDSFAAVDNILAIGGWQLDLTSLVIEDQSSTLLDLSGSGVISGNGYDATIVDWTMTAQSTTSYSMAIISTGVVTSTTTIPVPAGVWLFGSALLGLGVIRRKV